MVVKTKDVHTEHCCLQHGCKYDDPTCTVVSGQLEQSFKCELCFDEDAREQGDPVGYQARHSANEPWFFTDKPGYWEWRPLYTNPDSGEVERLRAKLAERDSLLREAITVCRTNDLHITADYFEGKLSASADND